MTVLHSGRVIVGVAMLTIDSMTEGMLPGPVPDPPIHKRRAILGPPGPTPGSTYPPVGALW